MWQKRRASEASFFTGSFAQQMTSTTGSTMCRSSSSSFRSHLSSKCLQWIHPCTQLCSDLSSQTWHSHDPIDNLVSSDRAKHAYKVSHLDEAWRVVRSLPEKRRTTFLSSSFALPRLSRHQNCMQQIFVFPWFHKQVRCNLEHGVWKVPISLIPILLMWDVLSSQKICMTLSKAFNSMFILRAKQNHIVFRGMQLKGALRQITMILRDSRFSVNWCVCNRQGHRIFLHGSGWWHNLDKLTFCGWLHHSTGICFDRTFLMLFRDFTLHKL